MHTRQRLPEARPAHCPLRRTVAAYAALTVRTVTAPRAPRLLVDAGSQRADDRSQERQGLHEVSLLRQREHGHDGALLVSEDGKQPFHARTDN